MYSGCRHPTVTVTGRPVSARARGHRRAVCVGCGGGWGWGNAWAGGACACAGAGPCALAHLQRRGFLCRRSLHHVVVARVRNLVVHTQLEPAGRLEELGVDGLRVGGSPVLPEERAGLLADVCLLLGAALPGTRGAQYRAVQRQRLGSAPAHRALSSARVMSQRGSHARARVEGQMVAGWVGGWVGWEGGASPLPARARASWLSLSRVSVRRARAGRARQRARRGV